MRSSSHHSFSSLANAAAASLASDPSSFSSDPSLSSASSPSSSSTTSPDELPFWHKIVGISLALSSAFLIGASFVIKKRGLLDTNALHPTKRIGEGHNYLKSPLWWAGMILMLLGELCNVAAYAFSPAILVTPLGAVSVVISAILSDLLLKEKLNFSAKIGCAQCILGAVLLVVNAPSSNVTTTIGSFWNLAGSAWFIAYFAINALALAYLVLYAGPRWGHKYPLVYICICSILGAFVVVAMQGFGSAVVYTFAETKSPNYRNQFLEWSMYPLLVFVVVSGVVQIHYLNKALNMFSTAIVTPIYYVFFTTMTLVCAGVLVRDFKFGTAINGVSALVGFLVIVGGVALLFAYSLQTKREHSGVTKRTSSLRYGTTSVGGTIDRGAPVKGEDVAFALKDLEGKEETFRLETGVAGAKVFDGSTLVEVEWDDHERDAEGGRLTIDTPPGGYASLVATGAEDEEWDDQQKGRDRSGSSVGLIGGVAPIDGVGKM
ncbi:hypothetical protein HDU97_004690 [Phlyctochytrium planicorne]|nr:hypothetical protein HDU97_004690 [Phlyctochytrium planicorne]